VSIKKVLVSGTAMGAFDGSFELLLVTAEDSSSNPHRVHELLSEALHRIEQSRNEQYPALLERIEIPLRKGSDVVESDLDQATAYLAEALAAYREGYDLRGDELPPTGWFAVMPKLDEHVRPGAEKLGPSSDVQSAGSGRQLPAADSAAS
jgi:hypothetical protein